MASGEAALMFGDFLRETDIFAETRSFEDLRGTGYGELALMAVKNTDDTFLALRKVSNYPAD